MDILTVFVCFETLVSVVSACRLAVIAQAILTMTGRITIRSVSRWMEKGGSYRSVNRFFCDRVSVGGDATTVTKSGK